MTLKWKLLIAVLTFAFVFTAYAQAEILEIWNCDPEMAIGWVKWESKPGPGVGYELVGINVYGVAITTYETKPGWYGITQYNYRKDIIYNYVDVEVKAGVPVTKVKFSCRQEN